MQPQQSSRFFFNVDWITILIYIVLCTIGFLNIYSVQFKPDQAQTFSFTAEYGKQLIFVVTGLVLGLSILLFDAKFFSVFAPVVYGVTIVLLLLVLVVGRNVGGNQAWILLALSVCNPQSLPNLALHYCWQDTSVLSMSNSIR